MLGDSRTTSRNGGLMAGSLVLIWVGKADSRRCKLFIHILYLN